MSTATPEDVVSIAGDGRGNRLAQFRCPGCATVQGPYGMPIHSLPVRPVVGEVRASWDWSGDRVRPIFGPSILSRQTIWTPPITPENHAEWRRAPWEQHRVDHVCHSFVGCNGAQPGQIIFLSDSTHALAGQVVDLVPWIQAGTDPFDE